jgi:mono/diheme cytochrome c family protein
MESFWRFRSRPAADSSELPLLQWAVDAVLGTMRMGREHQLSVSVLLVLVLSVGAVGVMFAGDMATSAWLGGSWQTATGANSESGIFSQEQASRGKAAYQADCAQCHLDNLKGNDMAPALAGETFFASWENKSVRAFYGLVLSTMPADNPGSVSENDVLDIVTFVLQTNGFPPGKNDLTLDEAQKIRITRHR